MKKFFKATEVHSIVQLHDSVDLTILKIPVSYIRNSRRENNAFVVDLSEFLSENTSKWHSAICILEKLSLVRQSQHQEIREFGDGRFSLWGNQLYFSFPKKILTHNESNLDLIVFKHEFAAELLKSLFPLISEDIELLNDLVADSANTNNTFFSNYKKSSDLLMEILLNAGLEPSGRRFGILGGGRFPFTAMRLLAEGAESVMHNDIMEIKRKFSQNEVKAILSLVSFFGNNKNLAFEKINTEYKVKDLEIEEVFFEKYLSESKFDFLYSNSVLEHVAKVQEFYASIHNNLKTDGLTFHAIDLKDHLHFFDPLRFLYLSDEEYITINTENRLRVDDHVAFIKDKFFIISSERELLLKNGVTLRFKNDEYLNVPTKDLFLTASDLKLLNKRFSNKSLHDLNTIHFSFLGKKS